LGYFSNPFYGTSAAAPHVAGIAALMLEVMPTLTPQATRNALCYPSVDIGSFAYDQTSGFGRFDAMNAVRIFCPVPVVGDWNGNGKSKVGLYAVSGAGQGTWYRDVNGDGSLDSTINYGWLGTTPVVGDWNNTGTSRIGVWAPNESGQGFWYRDVNGDGLWTQNDGSAIAFGWRGATPVVGRWNGAGQQSKIGVWAADGSGQGWWYLDTNGDYLSDTTIAYGWQGAIPIVGDWNGGGTSKIGVWYTVGTQGYWLRDVNGNGLPDDGNAIGFGWAGSKPVVGNFWSGYGSSSKPAAYAVDSSNQGWWYRDRNGNFWLGDDPPQLPFGWGLDGVALRVDKVATSPAANISPLTESALKAIVNEAMARWAAAGLSAAVRTNLARVEFVITDLRDSYLGETKGDRVYIDLNAAGHGWFVDSTPTRDEEFAPSKGSRQLLAVDPRAADRIDLLTVVEHELGHVIGLDDLDALADNLMSGTLGAGVRRDPYRVHVGAVLASA